MGDETLEDAAPSAAERQAVYEKGFRIWKSLYLHATQESSFPRTCFDIQPILTKQPQFPNDLDLKASYNHLFVQGTSTWKGSEDCNMPSQERHLQIPVSIKCPIPLSLSADIDESYLEWFTLEESHIAVLMCAWSYILSARWAELMPEAILAYTEGTAYNSDGSGDQNSVTVDIGGVDDDAVRWWTAILAIGGWEAYIVAGENRYRSPWSTNLPAEPIFSIANHSRKGPYFGTPISDTTALGLLCDYCALHGIVDQGYAALSAVLLLPMVHDNRKTVQIPRPIQSHKPNHKLNRKAKSSKLTSHLDLACIQEVNNLDKLLTMSCNTKGMRSLLSSIFYESGIACNVVSPWLQSITAVVNSVADKRILTHMLMRRVPHLAFLWLGGAVLNIQEHILYEGKFGLIPTEIHAAVWSGTTQSFMQEPFHPATNGYIRRSDECRLLYFIQEESHTRWPICQWTPFGVTALQDTEIDVRLHADCAGHCLQYAGWKWTCRNGRVVYQMSDNTPTPNIPSEEPVVTNVTIDYQGLNHGDEGVSENATRSIFGWLRVEGFPPNERKIHDWIYIDESDYEHP